MAPPPIVSSARACPTPPAPSTAPLKPPHTKGQDKRLLEPQPGKSRSRGRVGRELGRSSRVLVSGDTVTLGADALNRGCGRCSRAAFARMEAHPLWVAGLVVSRRISRRTRATVRSAASPPSRRSRSRAPSSALMARLATARARRRETPRSVRAAVRPCSQPVKVAAAAWRSSWSSALSATPATGQPSAPSPGAKAPAIGSGSRARRAVWSSTRRRNATGSGVAMVSRRVATPALDRASTASASSAFPPGKSPPRRAARPPVMAGQRVTPSVAPSTKRGRRAGWRFRAPAAARRPGWSGGRSSEHMA
jgi:hypothetical protein